MGEDKKIFFFLIFLEIIWIMTDADSSIKTNPINGKRSTVLVSMATIPKVTPKDIAPVSPIKKRAGLILNQRKANKLPTMTPQKLARSYLPCKKAIAP